MTDTRTPTLADVPAATRSEALWASGFGDEYLVRNADAGAPRAAFWDAFMGRFPATRILEAGCTQGDNLVHMARHTEAHELWGIDINTTVLRALQANVPGVNGVWGTARSLPFRDNWFDLTLTVGLLIHQPDDVLPIVMNELVRTSRRWVMCGEYHADEPTEINYRGHDGILFKRDYGRLYAELFPELTLVEEGFLTKDDGFDRVTYHVFEK